MSEEARRRVIATLEGGAKLPCRVVSATGVLMGREQCSLDGATVLIVQNGIPRTLIIEYGEVEFALEIKPGPEIPAVGDNLVINFGGKVR